MKGTGKGAAGLLDGSGSKLHKSDREKGEGRRKGFTIDILIVNPLVVFLAIHAHQEFVIVFGLFKTVSYEIHGFNGVHVRQIFA